MIKVVACRFVFLFLLFVHLFLRQSVAMQSWLFWNPLYNQDGRELTGIRLFPEPHARPRACKCRVNLVSHTQGAQGTVHLEGIEIRVEKTKICVKWEGNGLVVSNTDLLSPITPPPPPSYEVT